MQGKMFYPYHGKEVRESRGAKFGNILQDYIGGTEEKLTRLP